MKKKRFGIVAVILVLVILLTPIRMNLKDGGSVRYKSIIYEITKIHQLAPETDGVKPYIDGFEVKILGMEVFNNINDNESKPASVTFQAEILEVHDGYFLVKPESSWAINSADRIEVPMENMDPSLEPEVGDIIEISYNGEILETYPARLNEFYSIKVIQEAEVNAPKK